MKKYINSIKENYDNVYILKCDISKYFYNIDHEILINKLSLNKKTQIYNLKSGVNFLGYKFILKNKKLVILLNNQTRKKIKRKLRKARKNNINFYKKSFASYNGYFKVSTTNNFVYKNKFFLEEGN